MSRSGERQPFVPRPRSRPDALRVVLLADQNLVSDAVRTALVSRGFDAMGLPRLPGTGRLEDVAARIRQFRPEVGLLLCDLKERELLRETVDLVGLSDLPWLILTRAREGAVWGGLVQAGVAGVMPMTTSVEELSQALEAVADGHSVMPAQIRERVLGEWGAHKRELQRLNHLMQNLTPRELAVLRQLNDGHNVKAIALLSGVTEGTVRSQVKSVLRKLGVSSQLAAVAAYRQLGVLSSAMPETLQV